MSRIFLSYARSDAGEIAEYLYERLTGAGYEVWKDDHDLPLGANFPGAISAALEDQCDVIVLLTRAALKSEWVNDEVNMAVTARRRVIPIVLDELKDDEIPLLLRKLNWLTMRKGTEDWQALHRLVDNLEGGKSIPRIYNMSGHKDDMEVHGVLVLGHHNFTPADLSDPQSMSETARKMAEEALPYIKAGADIVPAGHSALACVILAYLLGITNQMPRIFYPNKIADRKFGVNAGTFIRLQEIRDAGFEYRSHL